ncbi:hypothetical protein A464_3233 [Salmonella bongori N268-08]|uniref:Uncharacterized protein n=1 Tax=Salmonella bongori N268-08 TaxID=1197719 RepID=S5NJE2_SALBN|nr:hypothetical protein A464_3233 [Salmonella bongori N268-08]
MPDGGVAPYPAYKPVYRKLDKHSAIRPFYDSGYRFPLCNQNGC